MMDWFGGQKNANFTSEIHLCIFFYRFPEPKAHTFILEFILLESTYYAEANKRVAFILDIMKLDVPDLFCDQRGDTSPPGETFKVYLHGYIASSGLSRDLLKCVDTIMVSWVSNSSSNHTPCWVLVRKAHFQNDTYVPSPPGYFKKVRLCSQACTCGLLWLRRYAYGTLHTACNHQSEHWCMAKMKGKIFLLLHHQNECLCTIVVCCGWCSLYAPEQKCSIITLCYSEMLFPYQQFTATNCEV